MVIKYSVELWTGYRPMATSYEYGSELCFHKRRGISWPTCRLLLSKMEICLIMDCATGILNVQWEADEKHRIIHSSIPDYNPRWYLLDTKHKCRWLHRDLRRQEKRNIFTIYIYLCIHTHEYEGIMWCLYTDLRWIRMPSFEQLKIAVCLLGYRAFSLVEVYRYYRGIPCFCH